MAFANGEAVAGGFEPGHYLPKLSIQNDDSGHALIQLENLESGTKHLYYVARSSSAEIRFVPVGRYSLSFAMDGKLAADCATLVSAKMVVRFEEPFEFTVEEKHVQTANEFYTDIVVMNQWATLFGVEDGNGRSDAITIEDFNR